MKIYFLTMNIYGMGGTVRTVLNTANHLVDQGYNIEIISLFKRQRKEFFFIDPRIKITVLHDVTTWNKEGKNIKVRFGNFLLSKKTKLIHRDEEAIHFFSLMSDIKLYTFIKTIKNGVLITTRPSFNLFAAKYANKGVVLVGQEHLNFSIYPKGMQNSIMKYYPKLDYLLTLTDDDTEDYKNIFLDSNLTVKKITNSIPDIEPIKSPLIDKTIIAAGRLAEQKGFDLLIKSFSKVVEKHPDWILKIYGIGSEKNNLLDIILKEGLYNNVFLMGATNNIQKELARSSIYVLSSRFEGFGMVIVEAMQCGVPVVSFDCPKGPSEIIKSGIDGILVENGNIEKLANSINYLIDNPSIRLQMGEQAFLNVDRYSTRNIGNKWEGLFADIGKYHKRDNSTEWSATT
ncbi:glycosyltransferase family 4 protein [Bacillus atrophaeus]|uniref:glycosyltransferase family 4 protein n=1 Tax=Bacillus atrophaeus TaxID=1452 RepID=UPI002282C91A|nr:glycosyltransferase family 4 protein [Bacillus atrophaeus]MCY8826927.1 glycosyltransferase family 4 protein [Bacillus atrophaeus]MCY8842719.1 glycosyltransferase family 4 protein [Bacillus atrophaeus]MEC0805964.1 glycosyltransferase family 4 protein [Bacillus atrophaeus]MEC0854048.1 glycosyltransferase family 4 protein [Bacillus atrophaeus]MEC0856989.1 glycosyltransferase family 4 protein [Bacillus atrophaeus]